MKLIKEITEHIKEEMEGVCDYIKFANKVKGENEYIFGILLEVIPQEIKHVEIWHEAAVREINKTKNTLVAEGKEIPAYMLDMWQEEHEKYIEDMAKIKYKLDLLKKTY